MLRKTGIGQGFAICDMQQFFLGEFAKFHGSARCLGFAIPCSAMGWRLEAWWKHTANIEGHGLADGQPLLAFG